MVIVQNLFWSNWIDDSDQILPSIQCCCLGNHLQILLQNFLQNLLQSLLRNLLQNLLRILNMKYITSLTFVDLT